MQGRQARSGGPVSQTLRLDADLVGGYDDNLLGASDAVGLSTMASGSVATMDMGLAYRAGNARHAFALDSRGTAFAYPDYLDGPAIGASATAGGKVSVGRSLVFEGSQAFGSEPFFSVFSSGASTTGPSAPLEQAIPVTGLFERRAAIARSAASMTQVWRRGSVGAGYSYDRRRFRDDQAVETLASLGTGDHVSHSARAAGGIVVSDAVTVRADYQYTDLEFTDSIGRLRPSRTHRAEGGLDVEVVTGRRRTASLSVRAGAARLLSTTFSSQELYATWVPVGTARVKVPLSVTWALDAGYRRDFSLLQGLANDVYATDSVDVGVGGLLARRTVLQLDATLGKWQMPRPGASDNAVRAYGGSVQVRQMLSDTVGVVASYNYYRHRFPGADDLPSGFPLRYDRKSFRVGITLRLPLVGARASQSLAGGR